MVAAPARTFSSAEPPLLLSASSPAAAARSKDRRGSPRGSSIRPSVVAKSKALLSSDFDLQQEGLTSIQKILQQRRSSAREVMTTIDNLKRLCIDHYFEEEIQSAMGACMDLIHSEHLFDATLAFRLMREAGHDVSADDVLRRFTDNSGAFKLVLSNDIRGLLSLHDMSHLDMGHEASLCKAKEFSSKNLASAIRYLEPGLARYVRQSLDYPYHLTLKQYKAWHHLSYLQSLPNRDTAMEELAIAEFQLNKRLHQKEMHEVKRWWMNLGLCHEIPVRDQVLKWYMWSMTILQGSSSSTYRIETTKIISLVYVVDDIFDLVGTLEELSLFTDSIKIWNTAASDLLPSGIRSCYKAIFTTTNEIANMVEEKHGFNPVNHLKNAWAVLFDGFMVEGRWLATDQVPTAEDYLRNGAVTSGVPLVFAHIFAMLGHDHSNNEAAKLDGHIPSVISCPAKILRLWDDMGSAEDEAQEGLDGSYRDFYLMENPRCKPGDAEAHMRSLISREWEELNRECFSRRTFSSRFTQACLNTARMTSVMYSYDKEQRLPVLKDYAKMLLL